MDRAASPSLAFDVRPAAETDRPWLSDMVLGWGADFIISRGRKVYPQELPAFLAVAPDGERLGLATFEIAGGACELVTLDALRFYQRRGMHLVAVHHGLRETARRLKPQIPLTGNFGIPLLDEIELEMLLEAET
jgi:hypothetical protein